LKDHSRGRKEDKEDGGGVSHRPLLYGKKGVSVYLMGEGGKITLGEKLISL